MKIHRTLFSSLAVALCLTLNAQTTNKFVVQANKTGAEIQPTMYGLFFEDINYGADGGLYAEMVKNRSFEFPQSFMGWNTFGNIKLMDDGPFKNNPHYVRLAYSGHREKQTGLENEGFFGMGIRKGEKYRFSVWARGENQKIGVELIKNNLDENHQALVKGKLVINSKEWKKYELVLEAPVTEAKAHLRIFLESKGDLDMEHISLFPVDTWKGHENGMRKDLAQALYDIHPGVFRFPGGCIVEGTDPSTVYNWKKTVGPVENRPLNENRWHYTFKYRFFPDYFQSCGLGFYEYFQLSEEIGAEPLPILNCGLVCQYQNDPEQQLKMSELDSFIQDALDLIEFANGDVSTKWGKVRADMGHPAPFNLKFVGIGNEQWGPMYPERLKPFITALNKKYPDIKIVGSSGPQSEGKDFDYLWPEMTKLKADLVDEHFYRPESWFLSQGSRYDNYSRKGPKVFAGEYACHGKNKKYNHFNASLLEAAFMTGLERNADVVHMATYAPLFAHVDGWQWRPDLIWFDNLNSVRTCSYYVQQLYSMNKGTNVLPLTMNKKPVSGQPDQNGLFASAVVDKVKNEYIIKVINTSDITQPVSIDIEGAGKKFNLSDGEMITYSTTELDKDNTLDNPSRIVPKSEKISKEGKSFDAEIAPKAFVIYKFKR